MMTLTELRSNLYKEIDHLIETGIPLEIERKGHRIKIILDEPRPSKLSKLISRSNIINGDPEDIIHNDWLEEWHDNLS